VGEYRRLGMISALELVEDRATKRPFDWKSRVGYGIYRIALEKGVLLRPWAMSSISCPLHREEEDIDLMVDTAFAAIDQYMGQYFGL